MIVYSKDDVPVACSGLKEHGNGDVEIKRVWVQPPFRGHHLATFMIHELEYFAHEHGYRKAVLMTRERMDYAITILRLFLREVFSCFFHILYSLHSSYILPL